MCSSVLKEQFRVSNFSLNSLEPHKFVTCQWRIPHGLYIVWRTMWALWHIGWIIRSVQVDIENGTAHKWLIYLTNISYLILTVQSIIHATVVFHHWSIKKMGPQDFQQGQMSWYLKLLWLLTSLGFDSAIAVTFLYWTLVFKELCYEHSIMTHAVNSVYVVSDIFVSAALVRLLHIVHTIMYGVAYMIFTVIYHWSGGTNSDSEPYIYKSIDWSNPKKTATIFLGTILIMFPLIHILQFSLLSLKLYMSKSIKCCGAVDDFRDDCKKNDAVQEETIELV